MRAGAITVQQTLTTEAASVLKHSLGLARRRGHAQVTPLHVATILLSSRGSLLRRACLKSQSPQSVHPLHSRALELCFNVALNRLPTTPGPLLHGQPSLSNALIAALKRAQAHQRRGCIEQQQQQQQQPLLAIKVELEQLILSILDDPSVSRVMREAGFSSTLIKNNLEESANSASPVFQYCYNSSTSGGVYSSPCSPNSTADATNYPTNFLHTQFLNYSSEQNPLFFSPLKKVQEPDYVKEEDVKLVFEVLLRKKKRNTIIVGDSVSITEGLVTEIMSRIERGRVHSDVPEELRSAHFIKFQFSSIPLRFMRRDEVEMNLSDLKRKVDSLSLGGRGVIIFTGDLKWTVENHFDDSREGKYSPVDHLVSEIGRLLFEYSNSNTKVWLMATADYQTYMKCQMKQPSLEMQWSLQAVSVPSGGLGLSLNATSVHESRMAPSQMLERKLFTSKEDVDVFTCCAECTINYEKEAALFKSGQQNKPSWLVSQSSDSLQRDNLAELRRKWSRLCHSLHQGRVQNHMDSSLLSNRHLIGTNQSYTSSTHPWWPNKHSTSPDTNSISFADSGLKHNRVSGSTIPRFRRQQSCHIEFNYGDRHSKQAEEPNLNSLKDGEGKEEIITLALGNILPLDSGKGERKIQDGDLCKVLQDNVPWQSEKIPSIVQVLTENTKNKNTWMLIQGNDSIGKRRLALGISELVFGSAGYYLCMNMSDKGYKINSCCEILQRALRNHEKLVLLIEDVDLAEPQFTKFLSDGFETGNFGETSKKEDCVFILTKASHTTHQSEDKKSKTSVIQMKLELNETSPRFDQKRKLDYEFSGRSKSARFNVEEIESLIISESLKNKKDLSRESSSNTLDLNLMADDNDDDEGDKNDLLSSDLETSLKFLESFQNQFVFDQEPRKMKDTFLYKIKRAFEAAKQDADHDELQVEEAVLDELVGGCDQFLENLFDKWLKDIFQSSLNTVKSGGKEAGSIIRLCLGDKKEFGGIQEGGGIQEDGFKGSILPKKIHF
ncbi:Clp R domain-containing protein [Heracleum sosnowskyi]|uniref:Clp R domain-containing protein n=1 Tax=Heracleum sosnowskyi TaxID=360622 RepID=A0AAD8HIL9_9APIA|nr:Clp R domain-containing protein [Heracleum sosnowskyi]